jgi:hypothetical protein
MAAEFDREWCVVVERVKASQDLGDLNAWLGDWRHTALMEMREPGSYYRTLAKVEETIRGGGDSDAVQSDEHQALIRRRLGHT